MDHQKTGALIAQRRHQLGMTQKDLAQKLSISDRTVSKWERGLGFPDISLIEPLADALDLTVLELLHGQEAPPKPDAEQSARETLQIIQPEVEGKLGYIRRWNILLIALLVVVIAAAAWLLGSSREEEYLETITAAEATAISPYILITGQDMDLLEELSKEKLVIESYTDDRTIVNLENEVIASYEPLIDRQGLELTYFFVQVIGRDIIACYGTDLTLVMLERNEHGNVWKGVVELAEPYPYRRLNPAVERKVVYSVRNQDNSSFVKHNYAALS